MKRCALVFSILFLIAFSICSCSSGGTVKSDYPITPVSFRNVQITDSFWAPRIETTRTVTLPYLIELSAKSGRPMEARLVEAASNFLAKNPDPALKELIESGFDKSIERFRSMKGKWQTGGDGSMGGVGTLAQSAIAFYEATGNRKLLDAAIEIADDLDTVFGPGKRHDISSHEGVKMGLIPLFRATGDDKYVRLAIFFPGRARQRSERPDALRRVRPGSRARKFPDEGHRPLCAGDVPLQSSDRHRLTQA